MSKVLLCNRFHIDLQSQSSQNQGDKGIAFHFNPRFKDGVLVRNTQTAGVWEKEEREGVLTLSVGADFSLDIICQENDYKVSCFYFSKLNFNQITNRI